MKKPQEISPQGIDYGAGHSQFPHCAPHHAQACNMRGLVTTRPQATPKALCLDPRPQAYPNGFMPKILMNGLLPLNVHTKKLFKPQDLA